jgi:hypothetical protein
VAITIDWATKIISVPQSYLTNITGTLYELDTDQFRLDLKDLEDDVEGMPFPDTHQHNTEVTVAGVTYARVIEIINGYSITFEDGQYTIRLAGSNNNFFDVENGILNQNQVSVIPTNSAGLITVTQGSGVTQQDKDDIIDGVWDETAADHTGVGSTGKVLQDIPSASSVASAVWADSDAVFLLKVIKNKKALEKSGSVWELIIYDDDDMTPILNKALKDSTGANITDLEAGTLAQELASSV